MTDELDALWEQMRERGLVRPDAPPLSEADKQAIREDVGRAKPMTEAQREHALRLLRGSNRGGTAG